MELEVRQAAGRREGGKQTGFGSIAIQKGNRFLILILILLKQHGSTATGTDKFCKLHGIASSKYKRVGLARPTQGQTLFRHGFA